MSPLFKKIMGMVRKTGGSCILFDPNSDEAFMLMDFAAYEALLNQVEKQTSPQLVSRLTDSGAPVKIEPVTRFPVNSAKEILPPVEIDTFAEPSEENIIEDERFYLEPLE